MAAGICSYFCTNLIAIKCFLLRYAYNCSDIAVVNLIDSKYAVNITFLHALEKQICMTCFIVIATLLQWSGT